MAAAAFGVTFITHEERLKFFRKLSCLPASSLTSLKVEILMNVYLMLTHYLL